MDPLTNPDGASSLPLDVWDPLLPHRTGCELNRFCYAIRPLITICMPQVTEIAVKPCMIPPWFTYYCNPRSTPEEDALKGSWVRVDNDLNLKTGIWYLVRFLLCYSLVPL